MQHVYDCQQVMMETTEMHLEVLQKEWVPKFSARQQSCELEDCPELEQVANKFGLVA